MKFPNHVNTINAYFKAGRHGADWYNDTYAQVKEVFGRDANLFCDLLAVTSANQSVKGNVTCAIKAYRQYKDKQEFLGYLRVVRGMLERVRFNHEMWWRTEKKPLGGTKVNNFANALKGDFTAVVVDRWMLRAFGYDEKKGITDKKYRDITKWIEDKAAREDMKPAEVQAAIWCGIKLKSERKQSRNTGRIEDFLFFEV